MNVIQREKISKIRVVALCLVVFISFIPFYSCEGFGSGAKTVMSLKVDKKEYKLSSNQYNYLLCQYKTLMIYYNFGIQYDPEIWDIEYEVAEYPEAKTYGEFQKIQINDIIKNTLIASALFDKYGLKLTKEETNDIDLLIKELTTNYNNSTSQFNLVLSKYGVNISMYKEILLLGLKQSKFGEYALDPANGLITVAENEYADYYKDNYVRVKHVLIKSAPDEEYDDEGNFIELPEEEYEAYYNEAKERADGLLAEIQGGADFESYLSLSEDPGTETYPDGYTFDYYESFMQDFKDAAFDMTIDEIRMAETEYGFHIMKKYELLDEVMAEYAEDIEYYVDNTKYSEFIEPYLSDVVTNMTEIDKYEIGSTVVMFENMELISGPSS